MTYFGPALDPPLGGSGRKTTTLVRDHEYFIPTKFHQNPSSGFGEEVENVKSLWTDDDDGRRTDDGRCAMTIAHSSLRLRWAKTSRSGSHRKVAVEEISSRSIPMQGIESVLINVTKNQLKCKGWPKILSDLEQKKSRSGSHRKVAVENIKVYSPARYQVCTD